MVFCGRPSRACYECRVRRIKCDQKKPECSQCLRANKKCSGYRDPRTVVIRDETHNVAKKARARIEWEKAKDAQVQLLDDDPPTVFLGEKNSDLEVSSRRKWMNESFSKPSPDECLPYSVFPVSVEDQGFCFIFGNYIVVDNMLPNGIPDYSSTKTWKVATLSIVVRDALISVGLAALSNARNDPAMMVTARKKLSSVLRQMQTALQDPQEARSDTTLRTVMMLWLFEMITYDPASEKSSLDHLNGAASLVTLRGSQNFENTGGLRKILRICFSTFVRYIQNDELDPNPVIDWERLLESFKAEVEFPACALAHTLFKFVCIRAAIKKAEVVESTEILEKLLHVEAELTKWIENLPSSWAFTTKDALECPGNVFGSQLHSYHDIWISRYWSHYRWMRIVVHETIIQHLAKLPLSHALNLTGQQLQSVAIITEMVMDICVSVPFHLCNHNTQADKTLPRPEIIGAFDLLWPLTVVVNSEYVSEDRCIWAVNLLESIGYTMGIKQALVLASTVKSRRRCGHGPQGTYTLPDHASLVTSYTKYPNEWTAF